MANTWYENHMMFDSRGNYSASDDYDYDYSEDIYIQCCKCLDYAHPAKGQHDNKSNFICDECIELLDQEYQQNKNK
jgi:hypothetical protein